MSAFKVGDVVHLKGENTGMTVDRVIDVSLHQAEKGYGLKHWATGLEKAQAVNDRFHQYQTGQIICKWFDQEKSEWRYYAFNPEDLVPGTSSS